MGLQVCQRLCWKFFGMCAVPLFVLFLGTVEALGQKLYRNSSRVIAHNLQQQSPARHSCGTCTVEATGMCARDACCILPLARGLAAMQRDLRYGCHVQRTPCCHTT